MNRPIAPHPSSASAPATAAAVAQAEARVMERDRMLRWRAGRLRADVRTKWERQRGRALTVGGGLAAGLLLLTLARRRKPREARQHQPAERRPALWMRWLPVLLSLAVPLVEPAVRRRLGARVATWLMAVLLAWRPGARRG